MVKKATKKLIKKRFKFISSKSTFMSEIAAKMQEVVDKIKHDILYKTDEELIYEQHIKNLQI